VKIVFGLKGKVVAEILDASETPRQGDLVFLTLGGAAEEVYQILRVAWGTQLVEGHDDPPRHIETTVFVLIESVPSP